MLAIADGKLSIIQYLLKNGADTEITDYRQGSMLKFKYSLFFAKLLTQ